MKQLAEQHKTLLSVAVALAIVAGAAYFYTVGEAPGRDTIGVPEAPLIQIADICRDSLSNTTLPVGETEDYLKDCEAGKYPQVIEDYVKKVNAQAEAEAQAKP